MSNIIETHKFILAECDENHNKWWEIELFDNNDVVTRWARVGNDPQSKTFTGVGRIFMEKKIREKERKGYSPVKTIGNSTVASPSNPIKSNVELHEIAKKQIIKSSNPILEKLIKRLVDSNIHKITSNTQITYNSTTGLFSTPIGIVSIEGISEARELLAKMTTFVREHKYNSDLNNLLNQYLRIIPQNLGMKKFSAETILPDDNSLQKQLDLVTSLESSYQALQTTKPVISNVPTEEVFKVDMDVLNDNTERTRLNNFFEGSKKKMHGYDNIRVKEMYKVDIHDVTNSFNSKLTPIHEVFHGSSCSNILSILKSGLKISPPSTAVIAGKMMGNGIYGAINSSKSIGYTFGKWTNTGGDMGYLIICDFAMGKIKTVYNSCSEPTEHDSVWAKAGSGLYNDELIVYKNSQCKIKYLLEIK